MPVATTTRKRKQTDDMAEPSPPKRVTRARAAKTTEEPAKPPKAAKAAKPATAKPTKIVTASARAAASSKAEPLKTTRTATKRKTRAEESAEVAGPAMAVEVEEAPKPTKTRGRPKKEVTVAEPAAPKTRTRQTKTATETSAPTKLTRTTKAKKATEPEDELGMAEKSENKPAPTRKATRGRAATATTAKAETATTKKPATRKRVAFEEGPENDKENVVALADPKTQQAGKAGGLRAKPVRKPASAAGATRSTRGRKANTVAANDAKTVDAKPLSPKKVRQVAKSSSSDSEDELAGASPVKALSRSPIKAPMSVRSPTKSASHDMNQTSPTPASPVKGPGASVLASPAKRPPMSPFKEAFKESPKRINIPNSPSKPQLAAPTQSPFKDALKASPKRVNLNGSVPQPQFGVSSQSSFKQSLLQSPARRPASPLKSGIFTSPMKENLQEQAMTSPSKIGSTFKLPALTPQRTLTSPSKGAESPEPSIKAHNMTPAEQANLRSREGSPSPVRRSLTKLDAEELAESCSLSESPEESTADAAANPFPLYRSPTDDSDSEDELQSGPYTMQSPSRARNVAVKDFALDTPIIERPIAAIDFSSNKRKSVQPLEMTPLALQLSSWCASSPEKRADQTEASLSQGISTPSGPTLFAASQQATKTPQQVSPARVSHFEDQMFGYDQEPLAILEDEDLHPAEVADDQAQLADDMMEIDALKSIEQQPIDESQASEQYGDENAAPVDPLVVFAPISQEHQQALARQTEPIVHTPNQAPRLRNREIHTVSKVPLRPSDDGESPIKVPRKRSKSISAPLAEISGELRPLLPRNNTGISYSQGNVFEEEVTDQMTPGRKVSYETQTINQLMTPAKDGASTHTSPVKSVRKGADAQILRGAVVYVDVHTSEGADASNVFVELLTSMGAKCIKQWTWNPRASAAAEQPNTPNCKIGITHVVYKDGGKRTLQKVREAKGLVLCVGVGWVLDCERENEWLEEAAYAVDTSSIPRGGHNRRKSMEPTRFSNFNGSLVAAGSEPLEQQQQQPQTPARVVVQSPTKEFLSFSAESRRSSIRPIGEQEQQEQQQAPATPAPEFNFDDMDGDTNWGSPTTPYFLSRGAQLVQQTCPPKQTMQALFPVSGRIEDHPDEMVRKRLVEARRKSLQWAPKVGSPLGRGFVGRE